MPHQTPGMRIGPARDVTCRINSRRTRFKILIDENAAIHLQTGLLGECNRGSHADSSDNKIRIKHRAAAQRRLAAVNPNHFFAQVEDNALRFVKFTNKAADRRAHDVLKRLMVRRNHVNSDVSRAEGCGNFQRDKAGADDDHLFGRGRLLYQRPTVCKRAKIMELRIGSSVNRQLYGIGSSRQQQCTEVAGRAVLELNAFLLRVQRRDGRIKNEIDVILCIEIRRSQRHPLLGRGPREIVLRKIGPIIWGRIVGADDRHS